MKLQQRIGLAAGAVLAVVSSSIGGIALINSQRDAIANVDVQLEQNIAEISSNEIITVTSALDKLSVNNERPILALVDAEGQITVLSDDSDEIFSELASETIELAKSHPQTFTGSNSIRIRSLAIQDDELIIIGKNLDEILDFQAQQKSQLWIVVILSAITGWGVMWLLLSPEVMRIRNLISLVSEVADGELGIQIPQARGNSEVAQLSRSLKLMLTNLQQAFERERRLQEEMAIFFGDISHELRTPLTVIRGYAELLDNSKVSESPVEQRGFSQMRAEINRMETLINDLMLLNELRVVPGSELSNEEIDLSDLVLEHLMKIKELYPDRTVNLDLENRLIIKCHREYIDRLFANIFSNIQRHTPSDAEISVKLSKSDSEFNIVIDDGGPGLPDSFYVNGIHHFQRFDKSRSRQTGGSGLGMSIIAALIDNLNGQINLSKSELGGLRMSITLPIN